MGHGVGDSREAVSRGTGGFFQEFPMARTLLKTETGPSDCPVLPRIVHETTMISRAIVAGKSGVYQSRYSGVLIWLCFL
jgi:hypothetical protein